MPILRRISSTLDRTPGFQEFYLLHTSVCNILIVIFFTIVHHHVSLTFLVMFSTFLVVFRILFHWMWSVSDLQRTLGYIGPHTLCSEMLDHTGHIRSCWAIMDNTGSYRSILVYTHLYRDVLAILTHIRSYAVIFGHIGPCWAILEHIFADLTILAHAWPYLAILAHTRP